MLVFTGLLREVERTAQLFEEVSHFTLLHHSLWSLGNIKGAFQINLLSLLIDLFIHLEDLQVNLRVLGLFWLAAEDFINLGLVLLR